MMGLKGVVRAFSVAALMGLAVTATAKAQDAASFYKGKTVRFVVGLGVGGGFDAYADAVIEAARAAGYRIACTYTAGTARLPLRAPFELRRLAVERYMDGAWFAAMIGLPEMFSYPSRRRIG